MPGDVHKSYEIYVRGRDGALLAIGRHALVAGDVKAGDTVRMRSRPMHVDVQVVEVDGERIVVSSVEVGFVEEVVDVG